MHWQTEQEKQLLSDFRARQRRIKVLTRELWELKLVQHHSAPEAGGWALQMIKSIEHELDQLQS